MRQRTKVREFWRVRWVTWSDSDAWCDRDTRADAILERGKNAGAKLYRVTVYRVAKLREVEGWRVRPTFAGCGDAATIGPFAHVTREHDGWSFTARDGRSGVNGYGHRTKAAAMRAAEDALAWLGYRVKKGER